jgi:hypothetical protein
MRSVSVSGRSSPHAVGEGSNFASFANLAFASFSYFPSSAIVASRAGLASSARAAG